jgi:GT2 family glycosyltransferase
MMPSISVVSPIYNSEKTVKIFHLNLLKYLKKIKKSYEIILVNDNSSDNSQKKLKEINNRNTIVLNLKKNVGQHKALLSGLKTAKGNIIVTLDSDMQDSPKYIPILYTLHIKKNEIYMASLKKNIFKNYRYLYSLLFWIFFFIFSLKKINLFPSNYLIFSKKTLKNLFRLKKNLILYLDFLFMNQNVQIYQAQKLERKDKKTSYNRKKILILAIKIIMRYNLITRFFKF